MGNRNEVVGMNELRAVKDAISARKALASRDWSKARPSEVLENPHRWAILKKLPPDRQAHVRRLVTRRIGRNDPRTIDPLVIIQEMYHQSYRVDDMIATRCLGALLREFQEGRVTHETSRLPPAAKALEAARPYLQGPSLYGPAVQCEIRMLSREILNSSPGFYELVPAFLMLIPGKLLDELLKWSFHVSTDAQWWALWNEMYETEAPASSSADVYGRLCRAYPETEFRWDS